MIGSVRKTMKNISSAQSCQVFLAYGLLVRLLLLLYSIIHDNFVEHIKYTDIDYHVFTNGSRNLIDGANIYRDTEYRYTPFVALVFVPNLLVNLNFGKLVLISSDIIAAHLLYILNIYQGTHRTNSKLYLILWLFNPLTLAISTRGSFEPILLLIVILSLYMLVGENHFIAGLLYGLSIHIKLYPVIYALPFYIYMVHKRPYFKTQSKTIYWLKTLSPNGNHIKFFTSCLIALSLTSYISFKYYGYPYLEQSVLYHMTRKDLQHNFSVFFYLFRLLPKFQDQLSIVGFFLQSLGIFTISILFSGFDYNKRIRLRKLTFSLFASTYIFVSLNKVCTSQYFTWYLIFIPLIVDSLRITHRKAASIAIVWLVSQANWLAIAYLYEYQNMNVLNEVGFSSILFLICNSWILWSLCRNFDASIVKHDK